MFYQILLEREEYKKIKGQRVLINKYGKIKDKNLRNTLLDNDKQYKFLSHSERDKARLMGDKYREDDKRTVQNMFDVVRKGKSNEVNPIKKDVVNLQKVMSRADANLQQANIAVDYAEKIYDKSERLEPQITSDLIGVVKSVLGNKAVMYGLNYRMKQITSLGGKIAQDAINQFKNDFKKSAFNIKDSLRYTVIIDSDSFTEGYFKIKSGLEKLGYEEYRCKNFYALFKDKETDTSQKAVQCVYRNRDENRKGAKDSKGLLFELQFHTTESMQVKEFNHPHYEVSREKETKAFKSAVLNRRMYNMGADMNPDPVDVMKIKSH